jgi:UDP-GlcNAc:undecaprenyl-phosphate GlcNAc-1-phosphate transferase
MTTIATFFALSALIAFLATPYAMKLGVRIGALDHPGGRKVHDKVTPRCGGVSIYVAFFVPFLLLLIFKTDVTDLVEWDRLSRGFVVCSTLLLAVGLLDDVRGMRAPVKLSIQIGVGLIAWWAGFQINVVALPYLGAVDLSMFGLPVTILWFVAIINAINLIDGLDGLATGTALFVSITLAIVSLLRDNYLAGLLFATFSGALLGFLRYNFNRASIFLGDSGSYLIGFVLAALGIGTSQKSSVTVAILIPVIALGLPLMDMALATFRRFVFGTEIFTPDRKHIHHRLLDLGYSPRRATLLLFGITILLGLTALVTENLRDDKVGLILAGLTILSVLGVKKLGYLEHFTAESFFGWFADISDEVGIRKERRAFLSQQMAICGSENIYQFWNHLLTAAENIHVDAVSLELASESFGGNQVPRLEWKNASLGEVEAEDEVLRIEIPLAADDEHYGSLHLEKHLSHGPMDGYTLKRVEHLRRAVIDSLGKLAQKAMADPEVLVDRRKVDLGRPAALELPKVPSYKARYN